MRIGYPGRIYNIDIPITVDMSFLIYNVIVS